MKNLANFFFEVGMLKRTPRTGFQFLGSGAESVAEHSFRTAIIGYTLARLDGEADVGRVVQLCLFHDVPEARIGDLNYVNKKYVHANEEEAVDDLARTLPFGDDYREDHRGIRRRQEPGGAHRPRRRPTGDDPRPQGIQGPRQPLRRRMVSLCGAAPENRKRPAPGGDDLETDSTRWWFDEDSEWWVKGRR